jgi:flagellar protein FliL
MAKAKEQPKAAAAGAESSEPDGAGPAPPVKPGVRRKLIVMGLPAVLALAGAGLWYGGALTHFTGGKHAANQAAPAPPPLYVDLPEMIANLDSDPRRPRYVKLRARIEVRGEANEREVRAAMPRLQDLFQTYLRDMRPDDLRGSMGTYRLREELIARADVAAAPAQVADVLFVEMLVQ